MPGIPTLCTYFCSLRFPWDEDCNICKCENNFGTKERCTRVFITAFRFIVLYLSINLFNLLLDFLILRVSICCERGMRIGCKRRPPLSAMSYDNKFGFSELRFESESRQFQIIFCFSSPMKNRWRQPLAFAKSDQSLQDCPFFSPCPIEGGPPRDRS